MTPRRPDPTVPSEAGSWLVDLLMVIVLLGILGIPLMGLLSALGIKP